MLPIWRGVTHWIMTASWKSRGPAGARAENVSYGCSDTACAIKQWANSSGHRHNMLLGDIHKYGLAYAVSNSGRRYWALELGE